MNPPFVNHPPNFFKIGRRVSKTIIKTIKTRFSSPPLTMWHRHTAREPPPPLEIVATGLIGLIYFDKYSAHIYWDVIVVLVMCML